MPRQSRAPCGRSQHEAPAEARRLLPAAAEAEGQSPNRTGSPARQSTKPCSTRARDQAFSPVSAFVASIAPLKDIALGGDGTMLRKTFIAVATTAAIGAAVALAPAVASARGGGGGGGGHGGGGHGGGGHGGAMAGGHGMGGGHGFGGGFHGGMGGGVRGAMIGGGFRCAAIGGGLRSAGGFVGSRSFAFQPSVA